MSNGAHPEKTVVDRSICRQLLDLLAETVPKDGGYDSLVHLFRAFETYAHEDEPSFLTFRQYQEYCYEHRRDDLAKHAPGTLRRDGSYLSTRLLEPACKYLDWRQRVFVHFVHPAPQHFPAQLVWVRFRPLFEEVVQELAPLQLVGQAWLKQAYIRLSSDRATARGRAGGTTILVDDSRGAGKRPKVVPLHRSKPESVVANKPKTQTRLVRSPIRTEHWELTRLACRFQPRADVGDDVFVRLLESYFQAFTEIVERKCGSVAPRVDGQMHATFGYPRSMELHPLAALEASLEIRKRFDQMNLGQPKTVPHLHFYIGIHTGGASIHHGTGETDPPIIMSKEAAETLEVIEGLRRPYEVLVSETTRRRASDHFDFRSVELPEPERPPIRVYRVIGRKAMRADFGLTRANDMRLIGREEEFKILATWWLDIMRDSPRFVLIRGMTGIGKSRLLREFLSILRTSNDLYILTCQCWPFHRRTAFYPIIEMIRNYLQLEGASDQESVEQRIRNVAEEWHIEDEQMVKTLTSLLCPDQTSSQEEDVLPSIRAFQLCSAASTREGMPDVFHQALCSLSNRKPVVLVVEDLQWADDSTRELLFHLADRLEADGEKSRILILCTTRGPLRDRSHTAESIERSIHLRGLKNNDARQLAKSAAESINATLGTRQLEAIVKETGGIPQAILEKALGDFSAESLFKKVMCESESEDSASPHMVGREFVAQMAAVAGPVFRRKELQEAVFWTLKDSAKDELWFNDLFDSLLETELIRPKPLTTGTAYEFCCKKIWEEFYKSIGDKQRQHIAFAEMLEKEFPESSCHSPEVLARHYSRASDLDIDPANCSHLEKATHWWHRAGEVATDRLALKEARLALGRARRYARKANRKQANRDSELHLLLDIITASELQDGPAAREVRRACEAAQQLAKDGNELSLVFRARWKDWLFAHVRGDFHRALEMAARLTLKPAHQETPVLLLEAHHAMWDTLFHLGQLARAARHHYLGGVLTAEIPPEQRRRGFAGHFAGVCNLLRGAMVFALLGESTHARCLAGRGLELANTLDHTQSVVHAQCYAAILQILARSPGEGIANATRAMEIVEERSLKPLVIFARILKNIGTLQKDPNQSLLHELETDCTERRALGIRLFETLFLACIAEGYLKIGRVSGGLKTIARAIDVSDKTGEFFFRSELHRIKGELLAAGPSKDGKKAKLQLLESREWAGRTGAKLLEVRALNSLGKFLRSRKTGKKERLELREELTEAVQPCDVSSDWPDLQEAQRIISES